MNAKFRILLSALAVLLMVPSLISVSAAYVTDGTSLAIAGDANGDNKVNVKDLVRVKKIIVGTSNEKSIGYDLNGNGAADSDDLVYTMAIILDIDKSQWSAEY